MNVSDQPSGMEFLNALKTKERFRVVAPKPKNLSYTEIWRGVLKSSVLRPLTIAYHSESKTTHWRFTAQDNREAPKRLTREREENDEEKSWNDNIIMGDAMGIMQLT